MSVSHVNEVHYNWIELNWIELNWIELNWIKQIVEMGWRAVRKNQIMNPVTLSWHYLKPLIESWLNVRLCRWDIEEQGKAVFVHFKPCYCLMSFLFMWLPSANHVSDWKRDSVFWLCLRDRESNIILKRGKPDWFCLELRMNAILLHHLVLKPCVENAHLF